MNTSKYIKQYKRHYKIFKELELKYKGNEKNYNFYGGEEYGYYMGMIAIYEKILDDLDINVEEVRNEIME